MAEPTPPVVSCGCEIPGWFVLDHVFGTSPMFMNTVHSEVLMVMDILKTAPSKSVADYVSYKHYSHKDWGTVADFYRPDETYDNEWHIEVWGAEKKYSPVITVYCVDRDAIRALAMLISQRMPEHEVRLQKWARIRCVWKNQKRIRDFPEVPYTNVDRRDWE